jgi:hypothetical protein
VTDTVIVRFEGDGSGVAAPSWGQHGTWCVIRDKSDSLPIGGVRALPPGQTVADHFVSPAGVAAFMRRIEAVLVDAAEGGTRTVPAMGAGR